MQSMLRSFSDHSMQCPVIHTFAGDYENTDKEPVAVMLGWDRGRIVYAPCTVCPEGIKKTPHGCVLLTRDSPAYADSGFTAEKIIISVRDAGTFSFDSSHVRKSVPAGILYPRLDKKLSRSLDKWLEIYNLTGVLEWMAL